MPEMKIVPIQRENVIRLPRVMQTTRTSTNAVTEAEEGRAPYLLTPHERRLLVAKYPFCADCLDSFLEDLAGMTCEAPDAYVRRRHDELRREGERNALIFPRIAAELAARRFAGPALSIRQVRRIIYG